MYNFHREHIFLIRFQKINATFTSLTFVIQVALITSPLFEVFL